MLRNHPGFQLLESEQVKQLGVRAHPLEHDVLLRPGRHYFLVALPRPTVPPRGAWSGALHVDGERSRSCLRAAPPPATDLSCQTAPASPLSAASEGGPVQPWMRLKR
ncbi:hypothetical protein CFC21_093873 [Triticum aestivum]|uniref:Phytocyanin domain-containing protein n=3 Tax=Triticinae TaxID=1648030 RepID=A0A9R1LLW9_WHEAT|nr:hypothetical protein CFC21_093873 [Triticum aestivum]